MGCRWRVCLFLRPHIANQTFEVMEKEIELEVGGDKPEDVLTEIGRQD